jgi:hypothetical protein
VQSGLFMLFKKHDTAKGKNAEPLIYPGRRL